MIKKCHSLTNLYHRWHKFFLVMPLLIIIAFLFVLNNRTPYPLNDKELMMVDTLLLQPKIRYFGSYSIEFPADFTPAEGGGAINGNEMIYVKSKKQYYPAFKQFLQRYEEELRNTYPIDKEDSPYLKNIYTLPPSEIGIIFERVKSKFVPDSMRVLDAWKWLSNVTFNVKMDAKDERDPRYDIWNKDTPGEYRYNVPEKKKEVLSILSNLHPREESRPPDRNRIAINFGEVDPRMLGLYELSTQYVNSKKISMRLRTDNKTDIGLPLLKQDPRVVESNDGSTIHKKYRNINGLYGSEWLLKRSGGYGSSTYFFYEFNLVLNEARPNEGQPLWLTMTYDVDFTKRDEILTESTVLTIWQHITDTIKYCPSK